MAKAKPFRWSKYASMPRKKGKGKKGGKASGQKSNAWRAYVTGGKKR
jgi:hypothetical protein